MKRLNLYMLREVLTAFLFATVAVSFVVLFTQSFRMLSFVIDNAATSFAFFQLMGLLIPTFMPVIIPLGLGVSVIFVYHKLSIDSEIVVMRASGVSPFRLALPALALAGMITLLCYVLTTWITPAANRALVALQYRVKDSFSVYLIRPGTFNDITDGLTFYAGSRSSSGELRDILVHDVRRPENPVTLMAQRGQFSLADGAPKIVVFRGKRQEFDSRTGRLSQLDFDSYVLDLNILRSSLSARKPDPREQTMTELLRPAINPEDRRKPLGVIRAEFHQRLAFPLLSLSYTLIGLTAMLVGEFNRRGMAGRILVAAAAIVALQAGALSLGSIIGRNAWMTPFLYALVLAPLPLCYAVFRIYGLWPKFRLWKASGGAKAQKVAA